jgi:hypothetical protein
MEIRQVRARPPEHAALVTLYPRSLYAQQRHNALLLPRYCLPLLPRTASALRCLHVLRVISCINQLSCAMSYDANDGFRMVYDAVPCAVPY